MSNHDFDRDPSRLQRAVRPRSGTTSIFPWIRPRSDAAPPVRSVSPAPALSVSQLIDVLKPPHQPSYAYARALAKALATDTNPPPPDELSPILKELSQPSAPVSIQAAAYEVMAAYCENPHVHDYSSPGAAAPGDTSDAVLDTPARLTFFSFLAQEQVRWHVDLWEARFKALRALTRHGSHVIGLEVPLLRVLQMWIQSAFEGMLEAADVPVEAIGDDDSDRPGISGQNRGESADRERAIQLLTDFLAQCIAQPALAAHVSDSELDHVMDFYARLVDMAIDAPPWVMVAQGHATAVLTTLSMSPERSTSSRRSGPSSPPPSRTHMRYPSSASLRSLSSDWYHYSTSKSSLPKQPLPLSPEKPLQQHHPAAVATRLFLSYLRTHGPRIHGKQLQRVLPLLLRALSFFVRHLGPLDTQDQTSAGVQTDDSQAQITTMLTTFFAGSYATTCMRILKDSLRPQVFMHASVGTQDVLMGMQTALGAFRALREYIRQDLRARLARVSLETGISEGIPRSTMSAAPAGSRWTSALPGTSRGGWAGTRVGSVMASAVEFWVEYHVDPFESGRSSSKSKEQTGVQRISSPQIFEAGKELILTEVAGIIEDVFTELDARAARAAVDDLYSPIVPRSPSADLSRSMQFERGAYSPQLDRPVYSPQLEPRMHSPQFDEEEETPQLNDEEAAAIGSTLAKLALAVRPYRNPDNSLWLVPLESPGHERTFLATLSRLLARDLRTYLVPPLPTTLATIADHLTDSQTARLPRILASDRERHPTSSELYPTSSSWLDNWKRMLSGSDPGRLSPLFSAQKPCTQRALMDVLDEVYTSVKDMPKYRKPLANLVLEFSRLWAPSRPLEGSHDTRACRVLWTLLSDEVILRLAESEIDIEDPSIKPFITLFMTVAFGLDVYDHDEMESTPSRGGDTQSLSPHFSSGTSTVHGSGSTTVSPTYARQQNESSSGFMGLLTSLAAGSSSRSQSIQPLPFVEARGDASSAVAEVEQIAEPAFPRVMGAITSLVRVFSQLSFTPYSLKQRHLSTAIDLFELLLKILKDAPSTLARVAALQFLMRLRADRDHHLFFTEDNADVDGQAELLASLVLRTSRHGRRSSPSPEATTDIRQPRFVKDRDGRRTSRGRVIVQHSSSLARRSRSRTVFTTGQKARDPIWTMPERTAFLIEECDTPSERLVTYDPQGPGSIVVLPVSSYLQALLDILQQEGNWEVLSYVLCLLPNQLSNKHLFCGPKCREMISGILSALCKAIIEKTLGGHVQRWTVGVKARDAQGLAFHTLAVLISYKRCFELKQCHWLIEVLLTGLDEQPATIKCCLHALSLAAYEMQTSVTKSMTRILEKLSQIMSNTDVAVHIMGFLFLIGALPPLYQNFRFEDFQLVFGVGLQYLQLYNSTDSLPPTSWALSQFVRLLSFSIVYAWFLAIRLPDRQKHIPYITRLLLTANEGKPHIDSMTEVCFDWLARYTYGSGDPRPANSLLSDIVMSPSASRPPAEMALFEKTWVRGDSIITIRTLARLGWVEIIVRRPSGFTKFLGRVENAPMVGSGDVRPDFISGPAAALMERGPPQVKSVSFAGDCEPTGPSIIPDEVEQVFCQESDKSEFEGPMPDPITGYVWSKTAPSQRRKDVSIDPSFFALQFCTFPDPRGLPCLQQVTGVSRLNSFLSTLDRMPVIDTHKVGILYVAPGQQEETEILRNTHGSPAYTRFLEGLGRLINLRGQVDVYAGGLDPDEDGEYAYAWWDDIGQILYHTATMMPTSAEQDPHCVKKKSHIGNDYVRIVWNDSGHQYRFDTLQTQFQFCNIVIEPHSLGAIAAFSDNLHENEYFKLTVQRADGMPEFLPVGAFKVVSAQSLPLLVRQLSLLADWFASVYAHTLRNSEQVEMKTNWVNRLESIQRFRAGLAPALEDSGEIQDFTTIFS